MERSVFNLKNVRLERQIILSSKNIKTNATFQFQFSLLHFFLFLQTIPYHEQKEPFSKLIQR